MQGGKIIVKGNCGELTGYQMQGGELIIKGKVKSFEKTAFSSKNQGTIVWKGIRIWEKGRFTKEAEKKRGEIPIKSFD